MSAPNLNLPQNLVDIDENSLPQSVRGQIERLVSLGHKREHLYVSRNLDVFVNDELVDAEAWSAAFHPQPPDDEE